MPTSKFKFNLQEFGGSVGHPRKKRESRFVGVGVRDTDFYDYCVVPNRCDFLRWAGSVDD